MKDVKFFNIILLGFLVFIFFSKCSGSQKNATGNADKTTVKNMLDSQRFVFHAETVTPLRGGFRNLTSPYDVTVTKDTLRSYLPYFGRAYNPPLNPTESVLDFTSIDFSYTVSPYKKKGWNVIIKPGDKTDVRQYSFTVFANGSANLSVIPNSSDAISFGGHIEKKK